jgi:CHAD domain-containing protein
MRKYVLDQTSTLLRRMAFHLHQAAVLGSEESVHDLRVAARRFQECLRVFRDFYPRRKAKAIREELDRIMESTAQARNGDIAIKLMQKAKVPPGSSAVAKIAQDRRVAKEQLTKLLQDLNRNSFSKKWRTELNLHNGR